MGEGSLLRLEATPCGLQATLQCDGSAGPHEGQEGLAEFDHAPPSCGLNRVDSPPMGDT